MKDESGSVSVLVLSVAAVLCVFMVMITECCYIVTVRDRVKAAAETALESAVEYCTNDSWRSDEALRIDASRASDRFREYLELALGVRADRWKRDENGKALWKYRILEIEGSENGLELSALVEIRPYILTEGVFRDVTVPVSVRAEAFMNYNR